MRIESFWSEDRGDSNVTTAVFGVFMLCMAAYALTSSTLTITNSSKATAESNRLVAAAESALSHAAFTMNKTPTTTSGSGRMNDGSDVSWKWAKVAGSTATRIDVKATGTLGARTIDRTGSLVAVQTVGAEKFDNELRYVSGAKLASTYVLAGSEIKATNAAWATSANYLQGRVGVFDGVEKPFVKLSAAPSNGADAYTNVDTAQNAGKISKPGAPMVLSASFVQKQNASCTSHVTTWKSSAHSSKIAAGTTVCADLVIIDTPTSITGTGIATVKAKKIAFRNDVKTTASNQLRAWVDGNVDFDLANVGADKTLQVMNAHIYAGAGKCRTLNYSTGKGVQFEGSLACKRIDVVGSFKSTTARTISETTYPIWVVKGE